MADPSLFVDSGGELQPVAPEGMGDAARMGWIPASPKQIEDYQLQQKYGSQTGVAALEGAGRGVSLGLSTLIERALGVPAEDIAGREKANPVAAGVGEAAGVAGGLLLSGGLSGPSVALRAGEGVAELAGASIAKGVLGRAGAAAAGSAVEGAFYGAGRVVHEAALGDPNLTAQSALATIGLSAALLGGTAGAGKLIGGALREYGPGMLGAKVLEMADAAEAHANLNATNAMPAKIKGILRGKGDSALAIGREGRDLGILKNPLADSPDAILERANMVKDEAGKAMDTLASSATAPPIPWEKIYQDVHEPITEALRAKGSTFALADQFEKVLGNFAEAHGGENLSVGGLWDLRKDFGDFIYRNGKTLDPWVKELNTPIKRVYDHIDSLIERGMGDALPEWQAASRRYEVGATFATLAESGVERSAANNGVHLTGTMGAMAGLLHGGPLGGAVLGAASEAVRRRGASAVGYGARIIRDAMDKGGAELADKSAEMIAGMRQAGGDAAGTQAPASVSVLAALERNNKKVANIIESTASSLAQGTSRAAAVEAIKLSDFESRVEQVQRLAHDPQQLHSALMAQTEDWYQHAPQTAAALNSASARGIAFLASKVPPQPPTGPLASPMPVSLSDKAAFLRYWSAVDKPLSVIKQAAAGTLTIEGAEALATVHPELLDRVRLALMESAAGKSVPYQSRLMISLLVGQDMDGTLAQPMVAMSAQGFQPPQPPPPSKSAKLTIGKRSLTPQQQSAQREP